MGVRHPVSEGYTGSKTWQYGVNNLVSDTNQQSRTDA
jgi:hypothetical protein